MYIGRKIYYELTTGNVICDTGERSGYVVETTQDQDFAMYAALQPYQQSAVGCLQLAFGQDVANFGTYPYHVDITQSPPVIVWDVANPIGASLDDMKAAKKAQLDDLCAQELQKGFPSTALGDGVTHTYPADDAAKSNFQLGIKRLEIANDPTATFPFQTFDADFLPHTLAQLQQAFCDGVDYGLVKEQKKIGLYKQVDAATTVDEVNAITW